MSKSKKVKKTDPKMWRALEKAVEAFRTIWIRQKMRDHLNNYRAHGATTQIDFLADFELMIRKLYPEPKGRAAFWMYLWSQPKKGEDGKEYKIGSEQFAVRVGNEIIKRHLIPSEYFRSIKRASGDKSAVRDDTLPRLESICARYERLKREWQAKHKKTEPLPDCFQEQTETETEDSGINESQTNTDESTRFEEPVIEDALASVDDPFANQQEAM